MIDIDEQLMKEVFVTLSIGITHYQLSIAIDELFAARLVSIHSIGIQETKALIKRGWQSIKSPNTRELSRLSKQPGTNSLKNLRQSIAIDTDRQTNWLILV